jgi:uncharacterized membrane protein HdeD (DUF308 family)
MHNYLPITRTNSNLKIQKYKRRLKIYFFGLILVGAILITIANVFDGDLHNSFINNNHTFAILIAIGILFIVSGIIRIAMPFSTNNYDSNFIQVNFWTDGVKGLPRVFRIPWGKRTQCRSHKP